MTPRSYSPRKPPSQERSRETVAAIIEGAIRIFARDGFAKATIPAIAERAGVSVGSLYQYFPNKLSLLAEAKRRHFAGVFAELEQILQEAPNLHAGLKTALAHYLRRCQEAQDLLRLCADELPARPFQTDGQTGEHVKILQRFFERHRAELGPRQPAQAALLVGELVNGASLETLRRQPEELANGAIERELGAAISSYLT